MLIRPGGPAKLIAFGGSVVGRSAQPGQGADDALGDVGGPGKRGADGSLMGQPVQAEPKGHGVVLGVGAGRGVGVDARLEPSRQDLEGVLPEGGDLVRGDR